MGYNSTTPNLGLPQWILSNPPQMSDFNTAFSKIDEFAGPIKQAQNNTISAIQLAEEIGLCFDAGSTYNIGSYVSNGYVTLSGTNFLFAIDLPFVIASSVTNVTLNGDIRIRQDGNYIIGSASSESDLSGLTINTSIGNNRTTIVITISSGLSGAANNTPASAQFNNLSILFS